MELKYEVPWTWVEWLLLSEQVENEVQAEMESRRQSRQGSKGPPTA